MAINGIAETMQGARAKVYVANRLVGVATSVSFNVSHGAEAIHTLGRFEAQEIVLTSYEAVSVTLNGFVVIGKGVYHKENGKSIATPLGELFKNVEFDIHIEDIETKKVIRRVTRCRNTGVSSELGAKATNTYTVTFLGITLQDESIEEGVLFEDPGDPAKFQ